MPFRLGGPRSEVGGQKSAGFDKRGKPTACGLIKESLLQIHSGEETQTRHSNSGKRFQMKAIVYEKYGSPDVVEIREVSKPVPLDNEVLIKVHAASVNAYDWHFLTADIFLIRLMGGGLLKPKDPRLGADVAGRIEAVGKNVRQFQPGDDVFGMVHGGFAEYASAPADALALKPVNLSF